MSEAVILMAYGSPERLADVPAYYADIRGGRPIAPENLADLVERYRQLGIEDSSPLNAITEQMRAALEAELGLPVYTGMKHWSPRIADAAESALAGRGELSFVDSWHTERGFIELLADRVRGTQSHVVFTAHSLPERVLAMGDPYKEQLLETAGLVAAASDLGEEWSFSFQSESPTGEPWLGPDILDHLAALRENGVTDVLVCPVGFVSDHLEIRWDIDVEAQERATELGMRVDRIEMPNADPAFVTTLAGIVRRVLRVASPA